MNDQQRRTALATLYVNGDPDLRLCVYMGQSESDTTDKFHKLMAMEFTS
ncbi:hypothetical protein [Chroococcidiopsis sp. CCMEE 29]|nr:hypothetical protein [Chroococcidiopsis sp. CCMEE 29]